MRGWLPYCARSAGKLAYSAAETPARQRNNSGRRAAPGKPMAPPHPNSGKARKIVVSKDETTVVEGSGEQSEIEGRIKQIKAEIDNTDSDWDREKLV